MIQRRDSLKTPSGKVGVYLGQGPKGYQMVMVHCGEPGKWRVERMMDALFHRCVKAPLPLGEVCPL